MQSRVDKMENRMKEAHGEMDELKRENRKKENVGGSTQAMKHKNDARSLVMMPYDKIEPMIWERF